jgi:hypothetical protein
MHNFNNTAKKCKKSISQNWPFKPVINSAYKHVKSASPNKELEIFSPRNQSDNKNKCETKGPTSSQLKAQAKVDIMMRGQYPVILEEKDEETPLIKTLNSAAILNHYNAKPKITSQFPFSPLIGKKSNTMANQKHSLIKRIIGKDSVEDVILYESAKHAYRTQENAQTYIQPKYPKPKATAPSIAEIKSKLKVSK